ncbi:MAG: hypothetical protein AAFQ67_02970 [Pseudomonadota bacterium]
MTLVLQKPVSVAGVWVAAIVHRQINVFPHRAGVSGNVSETPTALLLGRRGATTLIVLEARAGLSGSSRAALAAHQSAFEAQIANQ